MPQSLSVVYLHLVFSTKDRQPFLRGPGLRAEMHAWLGRASSIWIKARDSQLQHFAWQAGYGVFAVCSTHLEPVRDYIVNQETHHNNSSFQDEYRMLLREHGESWDERYVWD